MVFLDFIRILHSALSLKLEHITYYGRRNIFFPVNIFYLFMMKNTFSRRQLAYQLDDLHPKLEYLGLNLALVPVSADWETAVMLQGTGFLLHMSVLWLEILPSGWVPRSALVVGGIWIVN